MQAGYLRSDLRSGAIVTTDVLSAEAFAALTTDDMGEMTRQRAQIDAYAALLARCTALEGNLVKLEELLKTQGQTGNWDCDPYMLGMYNGMALAYSCALDGGITEPAFRSAPEKWLDAPAEQQLREARTRIGELEMAVQLLRENFGASRDR